MTNPAENAVLTQVGPGTPMGELMRQYWFPVAGSDEVEADGDPMRLKVLGEKLIAFRDSSGRVGVMDHRCPHRCASLFFGRNEEDGIRCVYHGWKFDVEGNCLDQANVPQHQDFKHKVKARAYKARDRYGAIWVYMGARETPPPFPDFELNDIDEAELTIRMIQMEYNWVQGIENDLDTSHFSFLHIGGIDPDSIDPNDLLYEAANEPAPEFEIEETSMGLMYGAYRPADENNTHWRVGQFMAPFWVMPPIGPTEVFVGMKCFVPMDDTHTMTIFIYRNQPSAPIGRFKNGEIIPGLGLEGYKGLMEYRDNTTDWVGRWRLRNSRENDYLIDRDAQRNGVVYTGINGLHVQDVAVGGMMDVINDRQFEHLAASDVMIIQWRRKLLRLARAFQKDNSIAPPGVDEPDGYRGHRGGNFVAPNGVPFQQAYEDRMRNATGHAPRWAAE